MGEIIKIIPEITLDKYNVTLNQDVTEIDVKIEHQTREINVYVQSFSGALQNFYTKDEADARFMPITYVPDWDEVTNKPTEFPPSAHTHEISDVIGLQNELDGKQPTGDYLINSDLNPIRTDIQSIQGDISDINLDISGINGEIDTINGDISALDLRVDNTEADIQGIDSSISTINGQITDIYSDLDGKVDKIIGKQLSTEDYTTIEKNKLAGIQSGAEVNVNADWNSVSGDSQIFNKPSLSDVAISGDYGDLNNIPTEFTPAPHSHPISDIDGLQTELYGKQPVGDYLVDSDLDLIRTDISTIQGDISDINYEIGQIDLTLETKVDKITGKGLSTEDYTTTEKSKLAGIESGAEVNVNADWNAVGGDAQILNKPTEFTPSAHTHSISDVIDLQDTLDLKADLVNGLVPASQLPSFVDDVIEVANYAALPITGESGKIYITQDDNKTYRWSGTGYAEISSSLALGETSSTAYRGDRGKIAYDHSQTTGNPHGTTKSDIGLGNVDNTSDVNKPISTATQTALDGKVDKVAGKGLSTNDFDNTYKSKLDGIEAGAEVNVNADWDAATGDAFIYNKPTNLSEFTNDLPIPTLDAVTDSGNTTTNSIDVGSAKADYFDVDTTATITSQLGRINWDATDGTYDFGLLNDVTLQVGQEQHIYGKAVGSISNGSPVQFAGSQGDHLLIKTAVASEINANPEYFIGIATQDFINNQFGYVTTFGKIHDLNTSGYTAGSVLYFDSTNGGLTPTKPSYPNARIIAAAVVRSHATQGILMVRPDRMFYADWNEISSKPSTFTPSAHTHVISDVTGLQTALDSKEPTISSGNTSQYWRGDKTWQTLDKSAVGLSNVVNLDTSNPANITQSASYRFVTDTEKATWNAKQNALTNPITGTGASGRIAFFNGTTTQTSDSNLFWDNTNKRLGIGTSSPSAKLYINNTASTSNPALQIASSGSLANQIVARFQINGVTNGFTMGQDASSNVYYSFDGMVGIGTANPSYKLQVVGGSSFGGAVRLSSATTDIPNYTESGWVSYSAPTFRQYIGDGSGYDYRFSIRNSGVDYDRITIKDSGYVGLGTTTPAYRLDVNGTAKASSLAAYNLGTGLVYSNGGELTNVNPSDERLKNTIESYDYGLNEILELNPKSFYYNNDENKRKTYGFIAQEVKEVMPELIENFEQNGEEYYGVKTDGIYVALINAIKELKQEIDILKSNQGLNSL